jgi:hypothetical protein
MDTRNIIALLWVASILGGCVQGSSVGTVRADRVAPSNDSTVSKDATTFLNGAILPNGVTLDNGVIIGNGAIFANGTILGNGTLQGPSRAVALTALASRPLAKKD